MVNGADGMTYALRRVDKLRTTPEIASAVVAAWETVTHPGIVALRSAFVNYGGAWGAKLCRDSMRLAHGIVTRTALFFLHDYCPGAQTLAQRYFGTPAAPMPPLPEPLVWNIVVQVAAALRAIHMHGLACRVMSARRILVTGHHRCGACAGTAMHACAALIAVQCRVRINAVGVMDMLQFESKKSVAELQVRAPRGLALRPLTARAHSAKTWWHLGT